MTAVSASSGIEVDGAKVDVRVTLPEPGTAVCSLACNGRWVRLTFGANGDVDVDVRPAAEPPPQ